jgi:hypothetical protein
MMKKIFTLTLALICLGLGNAIAQPTYQMSIESRPAAVGKYRIAIRIAISDGTSTIYKLGVSNYQFWYDTTKIRNAVYVSSPLATHFGGLIYSYTVTEPATIGGFRKASFNTATSPAGFSFGYPISNSASGPGCGASATPNSELVVIEFDRMVASAGPPVTYVNGDPGFYFSYVHPSASQPVPTTETVIYIDSSPQNSNIPQNRVFTPTPGSTYPSGSNPSLPICTSATALPVGLVGFDAKRNQKAVNLSWQTSTEVNSSVFEVERSTDAEGYKRIGVVRAAGNSNTQLNYRLTDNEPANGNNYYRLKIIDQDGSYEYSDVRHITFGNQNMTILAAYPNPATQQITFNVAAPQGYKAATLRILDATGRVVATQDITADIADGYVEYNLSQLSQGVYLAEITSEKQAVRTTFVKQ